MAVSHNIAAHIAGWTTVGVVLVIFSIYFCRGNRRERCSLCGRVLPPASFYLYPDSCSCTEAERRDAELEGRRSYDWDGRLIIRPPPAYSGNGRIDRRVVVLEPLPEYTPLENGILSISPDVPPPPSYREAREHRAYKGRV